MNILFVIGAPAHSAINANAVEKPFSDVSKSIGVRGELSPRTGVLEEKWLF